MQQFLTQNIKHKEISSTITSKGQVTIPIQVRRYLGVDTKDKISFVIGETGDVQLKLPQYSTIESLRGAAGSLKKLLSKGKMLKIAHEEVITEKFGSHR